MSTQCEAELVALTHRIYVDTLQAGTRRASVQLVNAVRGLGYEVHVNPLRRAVMVRRRTC